MSLMVRPNDPFIKLVAKILGAVATALFAGVAAKSITDKLEKK